MRAALVGLALTFAPLTMSAQTAPATDRPAVLVADQVFITRDKVLVAQGNVEAFQGETRLRATAIRYDQATGALSIAAAARAMTIFRIILRLPSKKSHGSPYAIQRSPPFLQCATLMNSL